MEFEACVSYSFLIWETVWHMGQVGGLREKEFQVSSNVCHFLGKVTFKALNE